MVKKNIIQSAFGLLAVFLLHGNLTAQKIEDVIQRFDSSRWQNLREKLFVHTDKNFYMAGEILWFKIYATDATKQRPLDLSKIAYVELLNQDHKPVLQAKIALNQATGNGSFQLPYSINSSNYTLRAYTNWMKNDGAEAFFEKNITIVNALKRPDWPAVATVTYDVQFFPEGGDLVRDLNSTVGFKVVDKQGKGQDATGVIIDQRNDTIARFHTNRSGMGHFDLKPYGTDQYMAIVTVQGTKLTRPLPATISNGIVLQVTEKDKQNIQVHIEASTNMGSSVSLLIHGQWSAKKLFKQELVNGETNIIISKDELADGISQLTVFNAPMTRMCERLYFKRPTALSLTAQTDAQQYALRKKVDLTIDTRNPQQQPVPGDLSAAVYLLDSLQTGESGDILSYLWLQSDLKGNIETPGYYFANSDSETIAAGNDLMLTQGWRRFKWLDMDQKVGGPEFQAEMEGHIINGRVVDKRNNQEAGNITAYLSVPREKSLFSMTTSSSTGAVRFNVKDLYGGNEIVVQTNSATDSMYRIEVATPFSEKYVDTKTPPFALSENSASLLLKHSMQAQLANTYTGERQRRFLFPQAIDTTPFYGLSDKRYYLDDYTRFITMEEVMREYVAEVRVRKNGNQFSYRAYNKAFDDFFDTPPLVLMDGVPVFNVNKMIEFDPLKIRRIDVVAHKFYQNQTIHDGIVQYHTYQGDLAGYQLDANALIVEYEGLQLQREFYSPVYDTPAQYQSRLPDPRNVLYWSPDIKTDKAGNKKLSFFTADTPGRYLVVVQGITANGLAGSTTTSFTVLPQ